MFLSTDSIHSLWGSGPNDIWAAGADGLILRNEGAGWFPVRSPTVETLYGVYGSPGHVWFFGWGGLILKLIR